MRKSENHSKNVKKIVFDDVLTAFIPKFGTPESETNNSNTDPDQYRSHVKEGGASIYFD